jgi:hypothetical protein
MILKTLVSISVVIGIFLAFVAIQDPNYEIGRSIMIHASAEKIFPYLNNSKLAEQWGPWREEDPTAKMNYSGPDSGVGSRANWEGGKKLGTGSATIVDSVLNQRVSIALDYSEPMYMTQQSVYLLEPTGNETKVSWIVRGKNSLVGRIMSIFMNMDKMVGGMFEKGLSNLKTLVEKSA